jgi:hypothetical protein
MNEELERRVKELIKLEDCHVNEEFVKELTTMFANKITEKESNGVEIFEEVSQLMEELEKDDYKGAVIMLLACSLPIGLIARISSTLKLLVEGHVFERAKELRLPMECSMAFIDHLLKDE